jgi:tRNA dimethylallyltransferase
MGPTAAGKTALAVELVRRFPLEIISVDSALVYRGMDIGTAKPAPDVLREAPHRLIDIRDPAQPYSAAEFRADALAAMTEIGARGRVPLLVGGTFLYFRALQRGLSELPAADPAVRAALQEDLAGQGLGALYRRLAAVDPASAARLHAHDSQRILRALEVFEITGKKMSELLEQGGGEALPVPVLKLALVPADRVVLHQRIAARLEAMLAAGFEAEVRTLMARGDLVPELPALRAVGYRQMWHYLEGRMNREEMIRTITVATRQYARRQLTWLRGERDAEGFAAEARQAPAEVAGRVAEWLAQR